MSVSRKCLSVVAATGLAVAATAPAFADSRVEAGTLTCDPVYDATAGDRRSVQCVFTSADGRVREYYAGRIDRAAFAPDRVDRGSVSWRVVAQTPELRPGTLAGIYTQAGGTSSRGPEDAGVLTGGASRMVTLRPVVIGDSPVPSAASLTLTRLGRVEERVDPEDTDIEPLTPRR